MPENEEQLLTPETIAKLRASKLFEDDIEAAKADEQVQALYAASEKQWTELARVAQKGTQNMAEAIKAAFAVKAEEETPADPDPETQETETEPIEEATVDVPGTVRKLVLNIQAVGDVVAKAFARKDELQTAFKVVGNHWMAVWSNNFEDRDGEIFTAKAMDEYVTRVDTGLVPLPELWVWHAGKDTAIGSADWVATHGHFMLAAGQFYGGAAAVKAKAYYKKHAKETTISHGFTFPASAFDGKHYHQFNTFEISLLPRGVEANTYTSLEGVKAMAIDEKKRAYLESVFEDKDKVQGILNGLDKRGKALEELGVEFKDFTGKPLPGSASKEAVDKADKDFVDLLFDVLANQAEPITAATEALKAAKETKAENAALRKEVDALKVLVKEIQDGAPRSSQSKATEIEASHLSAELQKALKEQQTERDPFWNTEV